MSGDWEPLFLSIKQVMVLHHRSSAEHGGMDGVRDKGAVESALASARNTWFYAGGDAYDIAPAYAFHIAESQAFLDGNKRTAVAAPSRFCARTVPRIVEMMGNDTMR